MFSKFVVYAKLAKIRNIYKWINNSKRMEDVFNYKTLGKSIIIISPYFMRCRSFRVNTDDWNGTVLEKWCVMVKKIQICISSRDW